MENRRRLAKENKKEKRKKKTTRCAILYSKIARENSSGFYELIVNTWWTHGGHMIPSASFETKTVPHL